MTLPNMQSIKYRLQHGDEIDYVEAPATQAAATLETAVNVPALTNNFLVNLATLFPGLTAAFTVAISIQELTALGFSFIGGSGQTAIPVRAGGFTSWAGNTLPNIYINNSHATLPVQLKIVVSGS